jgi:hypothetical protein
MSELSEALLGTTGVLRPRPDEQSIGKAAELLEAFRSRARRLPSITELRPWSPPSSQGFSKPDGIRERLMFTPDEPDGVHDLGDEVLAAEWVAELKDAREQLLAAWPAVPLRGGLDIDEAPISYDQGQDYLALVAVIEDPLRLLSECESGAVVPAQLDLFASVYPDLRRILGEEVFQGAVEVRTKRPDLAPPIERVVRLVLGTPADKPILVPPPPQPPPEKPAKAGTPDNRTVAQRAASAGEG